jgi:hypothetical protein
MESRSGEIREFNYPWAVSETPVASVMRKPPLVARWE